MANATPESGGGYIWDGKVNLGTNPFQWNPTTVIQSVFGQPTDKGNEAYDRFASLNPPAVPPTISLPSFPSLTSAKNQIFVFLGLIVALLFLIRR